MSRTAYDHPDFNLSEQQEAVLERLTTLGDWHTSYDLVGKLGFVKRWSGVNSWITIGDAGRRMRELREKGLLESRKRGRYEEYKIAAIDTHQPPLFA